MRVKHESQPGARGLAAAETRAALEGRLRRRMAEWTKARGLSERRAVMREARVVGPQHLHD